MLAKNTFVNSNDGNLIFDIPSSINVVTGKAKGKAKNGNGKTKSKTYDGYDWLKFQFHWECHRHTANISDGVCDRQFRESWCENSLTCKVTSAINRIAFCLFSQRKRWINICGIKYYQLQNSSSSCNDNSDVLKCHLITVQSNLTRRRVGWALIFLPIYFLSLMDSKLAHFNGFCNA